MPLSWAMYHPVGATGAQAGRQELVAMLCADHSGFRMETEGKPCRHRTLVACTTVSLPFVGRSCLLGAKAVSLGFTAAVWRSVS